MKQRNISFEIPLWRFVQAAIVRLCFPLLTRIYGERAFHWMVWIELHHHLDASVSPYHLLTWRAKAKFGRGAGTIPDEIVRLWTDPQNDVKPHQQALTVKISRQAAASQYGQILAEESRTSLTQYINVINNHLLPALQTGDALYQAAKEQIEGARANGVRFLSLRFAPQLHTQCALTMDEAVRCVIHAIDEAPDDIFVSITLCALRHEKGHDMGDLAQLCRRFPQYIGSLDLAGDETNHSGVPLWFVDTACEIREERAQMDHPLLVELHASEVYPMTAEEHRLLLQKRITVIGHGIKDPWHNRTKQVCPASNVATGQVKCLAEHPINEMLLRGDLVALATDGLTTTGLRGYCHQAHLIYETFGWRLAEFGLVTWYALHATNAPDEVKRKLSWLIWLCYGSEERCRTKVQRRRPLQLATLC